MIQFPKINKEDKTPSRLMSRKQVLDMFQISETTLYRWSMKENKIPYVKINRRKFFKYSDIEKLIESNYSSNFSV
jgi:predicted site-specific integrase-resolvase